MTDNDVALCEADEKNARLTEALEKCREYFADRAGAENLNADSPEPNEEAELMVMIDLVMEWGR